MPTLRGLFLNRKPRLGRRLGFVFLISCFTCLVLFFRSPSNAITLTADDDTKITPHLKYPAITTTTTPRILLVSAFYLFSHSKHSNYAYLRWLDRFIGQISTDIYFFTSPDLELLVSSRPSTFPLYLNTTFETPFDIPPLRNFSSAYATQQHNLDPEKFRHSPEVYAAWNAKPYFVTQAIINLQNQGKEYDYVFWNDAGSFRDDHWYKMWPDPGRVEQVWEDAVKESERNGKDEQVGKKDLVFVPTAGLPWLAHRRWKEYHGPLNVEFSEGSFFGGSPTAMTWFSQTFYAYHNHYLSRSFFIGKDQAIFNALFFLYSDRFITMYFGDVPGMDINLFGGCCWRWWHYHFWFGDEEGGEKVREMWMRMLKDVKDGNGVLKTWNAKRESWVVWWRWWWNGKLDVPSRERLAPVVLMKSLLQRRFGRGWTPPERSVHVDYYQ